MVSEEKRLGHAHHEEGERHLSHQHQRDPAGYNPRRQGYRHRPEGKRDERERDKKDHRRKEETKPEEKPAETQPVKKQTKKLSIMLVDGSEFSQEAFQQEIKRIQEAEKMEEAPKEASVQRPEEVPEPQVPEAEPVPEKAEAEEREKQQETAPSAIAEASEVDKQVAEVPEATIEFVGEQIHSQPADEPKQVEPKQTEKSKTEDLLKEPAKEKEKTTEIELPAGASLREWGTIPNRDLICAVFSGDAPFRSRASQNQRKSTAVKKKDQEAALKKEKTPPRKGAKRSTPKPESAEVSETPEPAPLETPKVEPVPTTTIPPATPAQPAAAPEKPGAPLAEPSGTVIGTDRVAEKAGRDQEVEQEQQKEPKKEASVTTETQTVKTAPEPDALIVYTKEQLLALRKTGSRVTVRIDRSVIRSKISDNRKRQREFKPVKFSFNPASKKNSHQPPLLAPVESYVADFNLALNQVSLSNIDSIAGRILKIKVPNEEAMEELTNIFFEKVMQEDAYAEVYAMLVEMIHKKFRSAEEKEYNEEEYEKKKEELRVIQRELSSSFGKKIAVMCYNELQKERKWVSVSEEQKVMSMTPEKLAARVMEISSNKEKEYERMAVKKRALSIIRFVAELFKIRFFSHKVLFNAIRQIISAKTPENIERLCHLLKHVGPEIGANTKAAPVDPYVAWLDEAAQSLGPRFRFMVQDIKELRDNNWQPLDASEAESNSDGGEWKSSVKPRGAATRERREREERKWKGRKQTAVPASIEEEVETHAETFQKMESVASDILRSKIPEQEVQKYLPDLKTSTLFVTAFIKIYIESSREEIERGTLFIKEWAKAAPKSLDRKAEIFDYIAGIMPDLIDDAPHAPEHLKNIKAVIS